jgi:hypothetical protein
VVNPLRSRLRMNLQLIGVEGDLTTKLFAVQDVDAIVTEVAGGGATVEIVTLGKRHMLPLKSLVDDQSLRPMNA